MTFRHLKIFITVADALSMTAAAKILYIAQPTVSQAISELKNIMASNCLTVFPNACILPTPAFSY